MAAVPRIPGPAEEIALRRYGAGGTAQRVAAGHDDPFRLVGRLPGSGSPRQEETPL